MSVKDDVLEYLERERGKAVSGGSLSARLGVSRNAVFKAVCQLKDAGYGIVSSRGGYTLPTSDNALSVPCIKKYLRGEKYIIHLYNEVGSTNAVIKEMAEGGAPEWTVAVAERQSAGRGRLGRTFISPAGTGIYTSVLLRPDIPLAKTTLITVAAAVAAARAIENKSDCRADLKWVNDIYVKNKKVCGILTEASFDAELSKLGYAVLGVGINVAPPRGGFGGEVDSIAGAIADTATAELRAKIIADFYGAFSYFYENGLELAIDEYKKRQLLVGKKAEISRGGEVFAVDVIGVDENCALVVRREDGTIEKITSGEVSAHVIGG